MESVDDDINDLKHDSETYPLTSFSKSLVLLLFSYISEYDDQFTGKGFQLSLDTLHLGLGVDYLVFVCFSYFTTTRLVEIPHHVMRTPMVNIFVPIICLGVFLFWSPNFTLVLRTHLTIFPKFSIDLSFDVDVDVSRL